MEWQLALLVILGGFLLLMLTGMPVAFCFLLVTLIGAFSFFGGEAGGKQFVLSLFSSVTSFTLLALPLFILMGTVMLHSGLAPLMLDAIDKWLGRFPGRLGLEAVAGGTMFATLTGSSLASVAMMGSALVPEMEKRGYKKPMSLGPVLGSGGLAMMIPPSGMAIILGALAEISIGKLLIAILLPGLLMAALYAGYIIIRCWLQPSLAPPYEAPPIPLSEKLVATARYVLPISFIIFLVVGLIFIGVATPTEAAATGTFGSFLLAAVHRRLNWETLKKIFFSCMDITVMVLMILMAAKSFSQILAFSGATSGLAAFTMNLPMAPIFILIAMLFMLLFLGMFINMSAIIVITIPIFMPIINALGFDPIWFGVIFLINMEMAATTPPFGLSLFVMKSIASPDTTMGDVYRAGLPFLLCDAVAIALIMAFPVIALWLPGLMT